MKTANNFEVYTPDDI